MPKINQEEYEVLKEVRKDMDGRWHWLARDEKGYLWAYNVKPERKASLGSWGNPPWSLVRNETIFQFIKWEDEEPYNITELIEEYEDSKEYKDSLVIEYFMDKAKESEETEVKKDLNWLKEEIDEVIEFRKQLNPSSDWGMGANTVLKYIKEDFKDLINQLDEPEVLSQEWMNGNSVYASSDGVTEEYVHVDDLKELLVPKKELPVIPKFVADYIDDRKEVGFPIYQAIRIVREDSRFEHSLLREWLWTNKGQETFARAWLDGYEIKTEEEQKYYVDLESAAYVAKWDGNGQVDIYTDGISGSDEYELHLTEQEIKDYDERFWAFAVKVEELEE